MAFKKHGETICFGLEYMHSSLSTYTSILVYIVVLVYTVLYIYIHTHNTTIFYIYKLILHI